MLLGPIFRVEMVCAARRRRYFVLRVIYGLFALFLLWACYTSLYAYSNSWQDGISIQQGAELGAAFFYSFSWLQALAVLAVGPAMAVGTIATERERRTIEYLFTTDLSNAEIVLGKLSARLCLLGQLLLVGLPILFLFRFLGGIPAKLLVVTFVFAGSTGLLVTSLSICVSVWSERARDATVRVYLLLGVLTILPMILTMSAMSGSGPFRGALWESLGQPVTDFCTSINPLWSLSYALGNRGALGASLDMSLIWHTVGRQLLVSFAAILLATFAVRRVHLKETTKAASSERQRRRWRLPRWRRPLGSDAMLWKEMFAGTASTKLGFVGWAALAIILTTVCGFTLYALADTLFQSRWSGHKDFFEYLYVLTGMLGSGVLLLLAARAAGLITSEKERDCWLSLLSTPLTGREIIRSKMWGNLYSARWPMLILAAHWALGVMLRPDYILAALATLVTFLLAAWYVTNLGLCFSLTSQTTMRAIGATLGTLIFTSGGYLFCCCIVLRTGVSSNSELMLILAPCIPFLLMFPSLLYVETLRDSYFSLLDTGAEAAYCIGMIGYLIAGICLNQYMATNFNRVAGRTDD